MDETAVVAQDNTDAAATEATEAVVETTQAEPAAETAAQQAAAPDAYGDFALPDGFTLDTETLTAFLPVAKELGLTQDAAQKVVDLHAQAVSALMTKQAAMQAEAATKAIDAVKAEYGINYEQNVGKINGILKEYGGADGIKIATDAGLYGNKQMMDVLLKIADAAGPARFVQGKASHADTPMKTLLFGDTA